MMRVLLISMALPLLCSAGDFAALKSKTCEKFTFTTCPCGIDGGIVMIPVKLCYMKNRITGKKVCQPCPGSNLTDKFCDKFLNCDTCFSGTERCITCPAGKSGPFCTERAVIPLPVISSVPRISAYPVYIRIPRGGYPPHLRGRLPRDPEGCQVPDNLETAEVDCTIWPKHITCVETCIFGFTLTDGVSRELTCKYEDDAWRPGEFDECKPYLDCSVQLVSAGDVFCTTGKMKSGSTCDINCEEYEGHPAVPKTTYECKGDGSWVPPLPFCAEKGKEPTVAPPPSQQQQQKPAGGPAALPVK